LCIIAGFVLDLSGSFSDKLGYITLILPLLLLPLIYEDKTGTGLSTKKKLISPIFFNFTIAAVLLLLLLFGSPFTLLLLPEKHQFVAAFHIMMMVLVYNIFYLINSKHFV
jgi:hypothetical protein